MSYSSLNTLIHTHTNKHTHTTYINTFVCTPEHTIVTFDIDTCKNNRHMPTCDISYSGALNVLHVKHIH